MISVVGDIIVDQYIFGCKVKPNPEVTGGVVYSLENSRPTMNMGGAAAVAGMLVDLGEDVVLSGFVGEDSAGHWAIRKIKAAGIKCNVIVEPRRPTTVKTRYVVDNNSICGTRVDIEVTTKPCNRTLEYLEDTPIGDMLVMSDYGKGALSEDVIATLVDRAADGDIPVLVDPAVGADLKLFSSAGLNSLTIKMNRSEAARIYGDGDPEMSAVLLSTEHACDAVVTLGSAGMVLFEKHASLWQFVNSIYQDATDVTGAGDTVLAALASGKMAGLDLGACCEMAAALAAQQVTTLGITPINPQCAQIGPRCLTALANLGCKP